MSIKRVRKKRTLKVKVNELIKSWEGVLKDMNDQNILHLLVIKDLEDSVKEWGEFRETSVFAIAKRNQMVILKNCINDLKEVIQK